MDVTQLSAHLKYIEVNGFTLSIEERCQLELAFTTLKKDLPEHARSLHFWGKIRGTIRDYYIVYYFGHSKGETSNPVPNKHFFWCSSTNLVFSALPVPNNASREKLSGLEILFTGEFDTVLVKSNEKPKVIDASAGIVLPPKHLTELDRLAVVVNQINNSCSAVPKGAVKYTPTHQVCHNEGFSGLSPEEAADLFNWKHMRQIKLQENLDLIARNEAVYEDNFLDDLSQDKPIKCWSILRDATQSVAILRSQLWPGYYAYHRCSTNIYGSVYIGDGIMNASLPFML